MKDYKEWSGLKGNIHNSDSSPPFFYEREIWLCYLGENVGFEQDGKGKNFVRPVLIFKKFNNYIFWALPLSSVMREEGSYYHQITEGGGVISTVLLSQLKLLDAKRLSHRLNFISIEEYSALKEKFKALIP